MAWRSHIARYGRTWLPGKAWARLTLLALLTLAAFLRLWSLLELPFTHDELSALMRIYPSLGETIQRGVIELDTHPPGVQVFEWAWTRLFGMSEPAVKLPFILMGSLALFFVYRIALAWTSQATALISIALLATLQFTVLYAQIARPYSAGFFTTALLADQLTRYLAWGERRHLIGLGVCIVLSAYIHHFSLMLAGIMAMSGLFLVTAPQRKAYLTMIGAAAVAYAPNLPIFFQQLGAGGLAGWLKPPDARWFLDHLLWVFHFSPVLITVMAAVLCAALFGRWQEGPQPGPSRWLFPVWGLIPAIVGALYSILVAPVLQHSMLLFSFPYLVIAVLTGLRSLGPTGSISLSALVALTGTGSLIMERRHHAIFNDVVYQAMVRSAEHAVEVYGAEHTLVLFDAPLPQAQFHVRRTGLSDRVTVHYLRDGRSEAAIDSLLYTNAHKIVVLGTANGSLPERLGQVRTRYPRTIEVENHLDGQVHVLAAGRGNGLSPDVQLIAELSPARRIKCALEIQDGIPVVNDATTRTSRWDLTGYEFGVAMVVPLDSVRTDDQYVVIMDVDAAVTAPEMAVVMELWEADSVRQYRTGRLTHAPQGEHRSAVAAITPGWTTDLRGPVRLKAYFYGPGKSDAFVRRFRLFRYAANPIADGLFKPVPPLIGSVRGWSVGAP